MTEGTLLPSAVAPPELCAPPFADLLRFPALQALRSLPAAQQPSWADHPDLACIRAELAALPALIDHRELPLLNAALARVAAGTGYLLQVGECAELFDMAEPRHVRDRVELYQRLAARLAERTNREVVLVARMAGQYAKPRSLLTDLLADGRELAVYRGDAVNGPAQNPADRRPDPWRLLTSYDRSRQTLAQLDCFPSTGRMLFVSHEGLLRDYEEPLTRGSSILYASSAHLLWVGERTRRVDDWHVRWVSSIVNPIGVKVGPSMTSHDLLELIGLLNPAAIPGRLSLITRLGASAVRSTLPKLSQTVVELAEPVLWQCDPMHANTQAHGPHKVRMLPNVRAEITEFVAALRAAGCHPGGLHLEVTPEQVLECHEDDSTLHQHSRPPCDPRLNAEQAMQIIDHFADQLSDRHRRGARP